MDRDINSIKPKPPKKGSVITMRDEFAMAALASINAIKYPSETRDCVVAKQAYKIADAMMKERK